VWVAGTVAAQKAETQAAAQAEAPGAIAPLTPLLAKQVSAGLPSDIATALCARAAFLRSVLPRPPLTQPLAPPRQMRATREAILGSDFVTGRAMMAPLWTDRLGEQWRLEGRDPMATYYEEDFVSRFLTSPEGERNGAWACWGSGW
jgi:hypothetical protein